MTDEIKLVYATAEDMIHTFQQGVEQLQNTNQQMQAVAGMLEEGALLGRGGKRLPTPFAVNFARQLCVWMTNFKSWPAMFKRQLTICNRRIKPPPASFKGRDNYVWSN